MSRFGFGFIFPNVAPNTPATIFGADLAAWYKADTGITQSSNQISSWADQSGNGVTLSQSTSAAKPTYNATGLNNLPTVQFDPSNGATGNLLTSASAALTMGSNKHSCFAVLNLRSLGHANDAWLFAFLRSSGVGFPWDNTQSCIWAAIANADNKLNATNNSNRYAITPVAISTIYRFGMVADGANWTSYLGNVQQAQTAFNQTLAAAGQLQVGAESGFTDATRGIFDLSELVLVKRDATSTERATLDDYFKNKWGLS